MKEYLKAGQYLNGNIWVAVFGWQYLDGSIWMEDSRFFTGR